jgi:S1/P1 Nuclease
MMGRNRMVKRAWLFALLLAVAQPQQAGAWGASGHAIVAEIAQRRLEPAVLKKIRVLLGGGRSLASIANWADTIALTRPETRNWHFVNIPVGATGYDPARDCGDTPSGDCIVNAIARSRATLANVRAPRLKRAEALKFLVHLVGDIHQPLHCAERDHDAGANTLIVTFLGNRTSLHLLWDVGLIEKRTYDWGELADRIEQDWIATRKVVELARGGPADWAWQTHRAAVEVAYALPEDLQLAQPYFDRSFPTVERQLALAGVRLARLLNEALR